jgi:hypothetical protein
LKDVEVEAEIFVRRGRSCMGDIPRVEGSQPFHRFDFRSFQTERGLFRGPTGVVLEEAGGDPEAVCDQDKLRIIPCCLFFPPEKKVGEFREEAPGDLFPF